MHLFTGSGVALVTPFNDGRIDYEQLETLIEWHIAHDTDALIICGTTGESATLTKDEKKALIAFTVEKTKGRLPVIAGTGGNNTSDAIELSLFAEKAGVDGLLIVTPYYNKCTQSGLIAHYQALAEAVNLPIILYNVPARTGVNIAPETVYALSKHPNIIAIKEASGDISQVAKVARLCSEDFGIYSGNDDQIVPILSLGGIGVISVVANVLPKETHDIVAFYRSGQMQSALALQLKLLSFINTLFIEVNPIPVKAAMNLMGLQVGSLRLPLTDLEEGHRQVLIREMTALSLLSPTAEQGACTCR